VKTQLQFIIIIIIIIIKLKHCDKGIVAKQLTGSKCGHVAIHPGSEFPFVVFL
jgi:hypothetical protein